VLGEDHVVDQCVAADEDSQEVDRVAVVPLVVEVGLAVTVEDVVEVVALVVAGVPLAVVVASEVVRGVKCYLLKWDTGPGTESMALMARRPLRVDLAWRETPRESQNRIEMCEICSHCMVIYTV